MRISDWSSDVCSSDLSRQRRLRRALKGTNMTTITIRGSYGELKVHRQSGHIIARDPYDPNEDGYADILWFDPASLPDHDEDILGTSFVCQRGIFTPAMSVVVTEDEYGTWHLWEERSEEHTSE